MPYNCRCNIWPEKEDRFFQDKIIMPIRQDGPHCVSTVIAMLSGVSPRLFQGEINTQDPVSWSNALKQYGMKLAYCPFDVRKLKYYIDELIELDDLFLLCYYIPIGPEILNDPNKMDGFVVLTL